jgi:urease beta subunit
VIPGEIRAAPGTVELAVGRERIRLDVVNTGDRPVQIGSHFHFSAVNAALEFDRAAASGFRLDIPAGTSMRFEPGVSREVPLVALGGARLVPGLQLPAEEGEGE